MREISLEESKRICFDILKYIDRVCRDNHINYSLGEGTLLGAVRHKGFIPWDDDIDVLMTRADMAKFLSVYHDGQYEMFYVRSDCNYWNTVARITDPRTAVYFGDSKRSIHGIWVALTPVDNVPNDEAEREKMLKKIKRWIKYCRQKKGVVSYNNRFQRMLFKFIPVTWLNRRLMKIITAYNDCPTMQMLKLNIRYEPFLMPSFFFDSYTELEFEGQKFMALCHYNEYLKLMYGDYMTPPPPEQRVVKHNYRAFYKMDE